ncbi:hypothetical protein KXD40_004200 [Peronospora effusa]|nr:hypothetical protein KXD40_004200 [Peronospora effusa]
MRYQRFAYEARFATLKVEIMGQYDLGPTDYLHHSQKIHIARERKVKKKKDSVSVGEKTCWALAAHGEAVDLDRWILDRWILDRGAIRYLLRDVIELNLSNVYFAPILSRNSYRLECWLSKDAALNCIKEAWLLQRAHRHKLCFI